MGADLLSLPDEILLTILHVLELPELLIVRELCHKCLDLSREKALWLNLLSRAHQDHIPLPFGPHLNLPSGLLTSEVETIVRSASHVAHWWPLPRSRTPARLFGASRGSLMGLQIFLDKWLLAVYSEGYACVWHIDSPTTAKEWVTVTMEYINWSSYDACLGGIMDQNSIVLAVTQTLRPVTRIYRIDLCKPQISSVNQTDNSTPHPQSVRAIDPTHEFIAYTIPFFSIVLAQWGHDQLWEMLTTHSGDDAELWNGILAIRFIGSNHLLVCKMRSVELHEIPSSLRSPPSPRSDHHTTPLVHPFPSMTFRDLVFSDPCAMDRNRIEMLAYEVLQGLFLYSIRVTVDADLPELTVTLIATYPMSMSPLSETPSPTPTGSHPSQNIFGTGNLSSRGFVSALTLGPQGKRAVWVERKRGSVFREVIVWPGKVGDIEVEMDGKAIFVNGSYDLRQDITHCAFGEVSGNIVLGDRAGEIYLLGL
ncbi:hypothetical protein BD779DRAFT_1549880 [Infundibulicybe gibba]|nr:hypothetical protein BD779DRAFT_1549880 [Infundibulicybe gibba]